MPNTLGTLASALILQTALPLVFTKRPLLNRISTDMKADRISAKLNQQITARIYSVPAVTAFGAAAEAKVDADVPVTMTDMKQVLHTFTAAETNSTDRKLVQEAAEPIAVAIANHLVDQVAALWLPANFPVNADPVVTKETVRATADCDYRTLVTLRKKLNKRGAPDNRFCCVNADAFEAMLNDPMIVSNQNNAKSDAINSGMIVNVAGFPEIFEYPALPTTSNLIGFAGGKDSTVLAVRPLKNPEDELGSAKFPGTIGYVTDPASGLTIMVNEWIGTDLSVNIRLVWMQGFAVGQAASGERLVHTATA